MNPGPDHSPEIKNTLIMSFSLSTSLFIVQLHICRVVGIKECILFIYRLPADSPEIIQFLSASSGHAHEVRAKTDR